MAKITKTTKKRAVEPSNNLTADTGGLTGLNFKVSVEFRREFRTVAAQNDLSLVGLLQKSLECFKSQSSGTKPESQT